MAEIDFSSEDKYIEPEKIKLNLRFNTRRYNHNQNDVLELARNILEEGQIQNVTVIKIDDEKFEYELICGHGRFRAIDTINKKELWASHEWEVDEECSVCFGKGKLFDDDGKLIRKCSLCNEKGITGEKIKKRYVGPTPLKLKCNIRKNLSDFEIFTLKFSENRFRKNPSAVDIGNEIVLAKKYLKTDENIRKKFYPEKSIQWLINHRKLVRECDSRVQFYIHNKRGIKPSHGYNIFAELPKEEQKEILIHLESLYGVKKVEDRPKLDSSFYYLEKVTASKIKAAIREIRKSKTERSKTEENQNNNTKKVFKRKYKEIKDAAKQMGPSLSARKFLSVIDGESELDILKDLFVKADFTERLPKILEETKSILDCNKSLEEEEKIGLSAIVDFFTFLSAGDVLPSTLSEETITRIAHAGLKEQLEESKQLSADQHNKNQDDQEEDDFNNHKVEYIDFDMDPDFDSDFMDSFDTF